MSKIRMVGFDPSMSNFGIAQVRVDLDSLEVEILDLILCKTEGESKKGVIKASDDLRRAREVYKAMMSGVVGSNIAITEIPLGNAAMYNNAILSAGMMVGILAACPIPLIQVFPKDVKIAAVGHQHACKEEMIDWALARYPSAPWRMRKLKGKMIPVADNEHLADAVATVHAGLLTGQMQQALAMMRGMRVAA